MSSERSEMDDLTALYRGQLARELRYQAPTAHFARALLEKLVAAEESLHAAIIDETLSSFDRFGSWRADAIRFPMFFSNVGEGEETESDGSAYDLSEHGPEMAKLDAIDLLYLAVTSGFYGSEKAMGFFLDLSHLRAVYLALCDNEPEPSDYLLFGLAGKLRHGASYQVQVVRIEDVEDDEACALAASYATHCRRGVTFIFGPEEDLSSVEVSPGQNAGEVRKALESGREEKARRDEAGDGPVYLGSGVIHEEGTEEFHQADEDDR